MPATSGRSASGGLELRVDAGDFKRLFEKSSQVPAELRTSLRRDIRNAAKSVAAAVQNAAMQPPQQQSGNPTHTGLRAGIAAGVGVSILTGNTRAGVMITSSGKRLDPSKRSLVRAWDKPGGWRHPVYRPTVWVTQHGRPYFGSTIKQHLGPVTQAVEHAMAAAVASLEGTSGP